MCARITKTLLLCVLAVLTGCAHFQPRPLSADTTAAQFDARRLDGPGLRDFITTNFNRPPPVWPLKKWDLNSFTLAAFYFHPDLAVARAQWQVAEAGVE